MKISNRIRPRVLVRKQDFFFLPQNVTAVQKLGHIFLNSFMFNFIPATLKPSEFYSTSSK